MNKKLIASILLATLAFTATAFAKEKPAKPKKEKTKITQKVDKKAEAPNKANSVEPAKPEAKSEATAAAPATKQPAPAPIPPAPPKPVEVKLPYILADDNLTNLQVKDAFTPVFDKYTIEERRAKGLPTRLPQLTAPAGRIAYLTFDDGPEGNNTIGALDILKQYGIKATFYVVGQYCYSYPEVLKRIFNEGHAIGNHSYTHEYDVLYPNVWNFMDEMYKTERAMKEILGVRSFNVRAPGGTWGMFTSEYPPVLAEAGLVEHNWNVCIDDSVGITYYADDFINKVRQQTAGLPNTAIVLMHCCYGKGETIRALPGIIELLKERGYSFGVMTPATPKPW